MLEPFGKSLTLSVGHPEFNTQANEDCISFVYVVRTQALLILMKIFIHRKIQKWKKEDFFDRSKFGFTATLKKNS